MTKFFTFICLCAAFSVMAAPELEISAFGGKAPLVKEKLSGNGKKFTTGQWSCQVKKIPGKITVWELRFTGSNHEPSRLAVKFSSPVKFKPLRFWDGNKEYAVTKFPMKRDEFLETFPLAVVEDGKNGFALGFAPENILSGFRRSLTADALVLETRIVVDDRKEQILTIVEYDFLPEFGWRNAVEDYQAHYAKWFKPLPGLDERIYGVSGYLSGAHLQRPFQLHAARHSGISWEWTYAPWYESGNWFPTGKGWKQEKNLYWYYYGHRKGKMLTKQEYHDALSEQMRAGNKSAAMFYYILVKDVHQNLADNYPDAILPGTSGLHSLPSNAGKSRSTFAPGTPLFDYLKEQLRLLVKNYEISGFAFDMANSSFHFNNKSQLEYAVGRSWYDNGEIFTSDTVLPIPFADYIHTLSRNGKPMGNIFNAAVSNMSPFTFFHCDAAIIEGPPYVNMRMLMPMRLIMGRKPATFWHPGAVKPIHDWQLRGYPEKQAAADLAFRQLYLLKCYELGFNCMNWVSGNPFFKPHLPVLLALSQAGYHPVSAIKGAEPLWVGRFGDDAGTILTFGNPKRESITRTVRVVNRYLGDGKYAFVPISGKIEQKFANGETILQITLPPKGVLALRTVKIDGNISTLTVASDEKNIQLEADGKFNFALPRKDFYGNRIAAADKEIFSGSAEKSISLALLPPFMSFAKSSDMVSFMATGSYPAVEAGQAEKTQIAAEMLAIYRPHVVASRKANGTINATASFMDSSMAKPDLTISAPGKGNSGKKICIGTPADFPGFKVPESFRGSFLAMPDANTLWIGGSTPEEVYQAAMIYFEMLDQMQNKMLNVNFRRPTGWGGNVKFINGEGQKYLQIVGDPAHASNGWRYGWHQVAGVEGGDEIAFTVSCKIENITAGKVQIGIYEFSDDLAKKSLRFRPIEVKAAPDWQTVSGKIKLHPDTRSARFYFLARGLGKGDTFLVKGLELVNLTK